MTKWCCWHTISKENIERFVPSKAGVYYLRVAVNGKPKIIQRFWRKDNRGTLYYGESGDLWQRLTNCWRGLNNPKKNSAHAAANYYNQYYRRKGIKWFERGQIEFSFIICKNKKAAQKKEKNERIWHYKYFLDLPPLNTV